MTSFDNFGVGNFPLTKDVIREVVTVLLHRILFDRMAFDRNARQPISRKLFTFLSTNRIFH